MKLVFCDTIRETTTGISEVHTFSSSSSSPESSSSASWLPALGFWVAPALAANHQEKHCIFAFVYLPCSSSSSSSSSSYCGAERSAERSLFRICILDTLLMLLLNLLRTLTLLPLELLVFSLQDGKIQLTADMAGSGTCLRASPSILANLNISFLRDFHGLIRRGQEKESMITCRY